MARISKKITGEVAIPVEVLAEIEEKVKNVPDFTKEVKGALEGRLTKFLEKILTSAVHLGASDIHVEPKEKQVKIRARIDGLLQDIILIEREIYKKLLSRIKLLSGLKLNITDRAQDGRFSISLPEDTKAAITKTYDVEIRTSALPTEYGETVVLRVLNPKNLITLKGLGLRKDLAETFNRQIKQPHGMIIVTGPTGSGKTTTLYAFLKEIQKPETKIITIEDPIEYHLEGISQTQVNPGKGYNFANGLRSIMRQDPDVVLVGEIRDLETATIALQAALTGHLVFSTLHTNDAAGTIARLQALGEKPVNIAPAINMAVAQRLIRRVCQECKVERKVTPALFKKIKRELKNLPSDVGNFDLKSGIKIPEAKGCKHCNSTGYRGRIAIFESFLIDDELEKFILSSPSIAALREKAVQKGMITMYQDGLLKVLEGTTTLQEVERVTGK